MIDVLNLALPYFGLIFLGVACGRLVRIPDSGLAWMDFFILYVALPALFYRILAQTPFEQLNNIPFIVATTLSTFLVLAGSLAVAFAIRRDLAASAIASLAGAYGNIGYMGPGLALATVGAQAAAPVALIFAIETLLFFSIVPLLVAVAQPGGKGFRATAREVLRRIVLHPLMIASALGALSAALRFEPPVALDRLLQFLQNAAAPCALFTLGVTVALRRLEGVPAEVPPLVLIKLVVHPAVALFFLTALGPFNPDWVSTAVLMAALPPALSVFVLARQYDTWVRPASSSVLLGTLLSVATLTTVMWLVQHGGLVVRF
ncbi:MAG: AEC family transporter [Alphaproteobacteria bacterium]|nr:AEC family transporter [Alphaproteobacteria bacterium]